jgi:hypothetical protein
MAARAGIEPGRPIWPSLRMGFLADSYGSQELAEEPKNGTSNGQLFIIYAPETLVGRFKDRWALHSGEVKRSEV